MVCMFSHGTEAFPCSETIAFLVARSPFGKEYPDQGKGNPLELHSEQGTHFTGQVL